jgi:hypothetical protein
MHDYFSEHFEWDDGIPRKRKRVARDREQIHFPVTVMDHAAFSFHQHFSDGSVDHTSPHRKGFRFLDTNDAAGKAADAAYAERSRRMETAWRTRGNGITEANRDGTPPPTRTLDQLHALAEQAYEERNERMRNAWRQR